MSKSETGKASFEVATLGGGCFWCLEAVFSMIEGVEKVEPGYAGGYVANPSYEQVCSGSTGHAEVAQVTFDPEVTSFREILEVFFAAHDPTTLNRQGADVGTQYRSAIFYYTPKQKEIAQQLIAELENQKVYNQPITTKVEPLQQFYPAENYHKDYYQTNPNAPYCQVVINPKIAKLRKKYLSKLKAAYKK
ncbi:MAG: peptide-methionine (S)-S-oxide reductase MsrA [Candidatus Bathyarchaeota archaeon]|nr:peptide-methionine (S)-S-oxide reductase MsrA [Candidatus Bathyarchaeota archaeon]